MFKPCIDICVPFIFKGGAIDVRLLVGDVTALMNDEALRSDALQMLSPYRRAKVEAINHARGKAQSIGAALLLDRLLNEIGLHERDMDYTENEHGKPVFKVLPFSLSHSGSMAAAAVARMSDEEHPLHLSVSIGVDIQRITRYRPELVRRVFSKADRQRLAEATDEVSRLRLFTQLWCHAEAYAKATGEGLQWPFPTPPAEAQFYEFEVGDNYCGSLCLYTNN